VGFIIQDLQDSIEMLMILVTRSASVLAEHMPQIFRTMTSRISLPLVLSFRNFLPLAAVAGVEPSLFGSLVNYSSYCAFGQLK
jgi:hypothetical protein